MNFRKAIYSDINTLVDIVNQAVLNFKNDGINQWQKGYPNRNVLMKDMEDGTLYVLETDGTIIGLLNLAEGPDPSYEEIEGSWMNDLPYTAFHTVSVRSDLRGNGYAGILFREAEELSRRMGYQTVRIDTHKDNKAMQHALAKSGYQYCGSIHLAGGAEKGAPRIGYQKMIK